MHYLHLFTAATKLKALACTTSKWVHKLEWALYMWEVLKSPHILQLWPHLPSACRHFFGGFCFFPPIVWFYSFIVVRVISDVPLAEFSFWIIIIIIILSGTVWRTEQQSCDRISVNWEYFCCPTKALANQTTHLTSDANLCPQWNCILPFVLVCGTFISSDDCLYAAVFQNVKAAKKRFKGRDGDRFDSLVEQYKKKLMGYSDKNTSMKRTKWFDS